MYKKEYQEIPADVLALTKTEFQLRQSLAMMIGEARETKDELQKEFKRLRREHYGNLKDIEQILVSFDQLSGKVTNVTDRQKLNDQAMASIFKVMKLDYALDNQDEVDRQNLYLMGLTNSGHAQNLDKDLDSLQQNVEKPSLPKPFIRLDKAISPMQTPEPSGVQTDIMKSAASTNPAAFAQVQTSGKFIKKLRASTKIPIEHKLDGSTYNTN